MYPGGGVAQYNDDMLIQPNLLSPTALRAAAGKPDAGSLVPDFAQLSKMVAGSSTRSFQPTLATDANGT
jgi:hypothetical protein